MGQNEELMQEISQRMQALGESVSEQRINALIQGYMDRLLGDEMFVRKMRFGGGAPAKLVGTKFARWGLDIGGVEFLYDLMTARQRVGMGAGPSEELRNTFQAISEAMYIPDEQIRAMDRAALDDVFPRMPVSAFYGRDRELARRGEFELTGAYQRAIRAMDTAESGYGSQLVGAQYVGQLWEAARKDSRIFALLDTFEMTAPTAYLPVEAALPEMLYVSESTASDASNYTTSKSGSNRVTVSAVKFVIHQMWSGEMEEDSIIPYIPFLQRQAQLSLAHYSDSAVLNGDTTNADTGNINLDDANPADTKHYLGFDGIRHAGIVDNTNNVTNQAGAITLNALMDSRGKMLDTTYLMDWGHPTIPSDLVFVCDPDTGDDISALDDFRTLDKFGPAAFVFTGEVGEAGGHPVIASIAMSKTEADGKVSNTAGNNTKGQVAVFNRRGLKVGWRRRVRVETERLPATDQTRIVYSLRMGLGRFSPTGSASGIEWANIIYNVTV
jgi:hypothetical protein